MYKNRVIKDYHPDRQKAGIIAKKRLKFFSLFMAGFLMLEILGYSLVWNLDSLESVKYIGIPIVSLHLLATITFSWILDFGMANKLRKNKFIIDGADATIAQNQTFYAALRYIGVTRLIINSLFTIVNIFVIVISFMI